MMLDSQKMGNQRISINSGKSRGAVVVEFAVVLPLLLILALSIGEFGRALYQYNALAKSARDAVRFISQQNPSQSNYNDKIAEAKDLAVYGPVGNTPLVPGLSTDMIDITYPVESGFQMVRVTIVDYPFSFIFGWIGTTMTFDPIQATMRQL